MNKNISFVFCSVNHIRTMAIAPKKSFETEDDILSRSFRSIDIELKLENNFCVYDRLQIIEMNSTENVRNS